MNADTPFIKTFLQSLPTPFIWTHLAPAGCGGPGFVQSVASALAEDGVKVKAIKDINTLPKANVLVLFPEAFPEPSKLDEALKALERHAKRTGASVCIAAQMHRLQATKAREHGVLNLTFLPSPVLGEISHQVTVAVRREGLVQLTTLKYGAPNS